MFGIYMYIIVIVWLLLKSTRQNNLEPSLNRRNHTVVTFH